MTPHVSQITAPLKPIHEITPHYSLLPIEQGFNWDDAFADVDSGEWYLVVFRSKHRADADADFLNILDAHASTAASRSPGFLYYFIGTPLPTGECLSFCLWHSQIDAVIGSSHPAHKEAVAKGLSSFEYYRLERYDVSKRDGLLTFAPLTPR